MTSYASIPTAVPVNLESTAVEAKLASEEGTPQVTVAAPLDLPEGYKFYSEYQGGTIAVTVPKGGVKKNHLLVVPLQPVAVSEEGVVGHWRDDTFDCFRHMPSCLCACCCQLLMLGRVMTQLRLNWIANPVSSDAWKNTMSIFVAVVIIFYILSFILTSNSVDTENIEDIDDFVDQVNTSGNNNPFNAILGAFVLLITYKVRKHVRGKYQIPEERCIGCEDFCCSFWCGCCVASQMARHTLDYDEEA